ncbi:uncharacterized protein ELE39_003762 [Cryptosporidium sp. chipmunk genotype I]|uniref:uncharacterized protein n=1 Tax=Cryptosporidium sp. chipmunk genotype I TaxID=1280935 RepID=UPI003519ED7B|nr:hypothetical protein ELE39_003762 [Cryptosporidium sp. chipmunk genotype I]
MVKERSSSIIKLENFENAEALIDNYRREFEIHRLHETLEYMLIEEDESITDTLNTAYSDYSLISTDLLPLVDSYLPSIKQFQEKIDSSVNEVTSIIERYSEEINSKINNHNLLFTKKLEQNLFEMCHDEIKRYREILIITKNQFNKDETSTSFLSIRIIHYCILRLLKIRKSIDTIYQTIKKNTKLGFELVNNKHYNDCFEICNNFADELKVLVVQASNNILKASDSEFSETEDFMQNSNLLFQCIFLLNLKDEFISKVKSYVEAEIIGNCNFNTNKDDKLLFSNVISDLENIIQGEKLAHFIKKIVFSLFNYDDTEYLMFIIDIHIQGVLLFLLEYVEGEYSEHIVSPTAPMDLFVHQLNSIVSLIEKNEKILINYESDRIPANKLKELRLRILICFRENYFINNYSKKWKFGTYWNLIYRNILNRRINIRNEPVEFSKVYVYDNKKYWLKYSIEIIRQIRWILGNSSIHSNTPLPPSRYLVPLFTRCLYSSLLLLYDYSSYLLSFTELSNFSEKSRQSNSIWSSKTKPEHICCVLMDAISFEEWVKIHFINELFFHIDKVKSEFGFTEIFDLSEFENVLDIDQLKLMVQDELINQDYLTHINENILKPLTNAISIYLKNQTIRIFESGLRAVPCLYRLTTTSISSKSNDKIDTSERVPSSYIENTTKPIEVFLIFSLNAIKSIITDLSSNAIQKFRELYYNILFSTFEEIFQEIFDICEKQILSSKHQLASLQKLAQKNIEGSAANRIDPSIIASQYLTDIDTWLTKILKLLSNFFENLDHGSENYVEEYINAIKKVPSYIKLYEILNN